MATLRRCGLPRLRERELILTAAALFAGTYVVFFDVSSADAQMTSYLLFPIVVWAAYRYRVPGAVAATAIVCSDALN